MKTKKSSLASVSAMLMLGVTVSCKPGERNDMPAVAEMSNVVTNGHFVSYYVYTSKFFHTNELITFAYITNRLEPLIFEHPIDIRIDWFGNPSRLHVVEERHGSKRKVSSLTFYQQPLQQKWPSN